MARRWILGLAAIAVMPAQAHACMTEPLPTAILFDYRPSTIPANSMALLVRPVAPVPQSHSARVRVIRDAAPFRGGDEVIISPEWPTSCLALGRMNAPAYVVVLKPAAHQRTVDLVAKSYARSWIDTLFAVFGFQNFSPKGAPLGNPFPNPAPLPPHPS